MDNFKFIVEMVINNNNNCSIYEALNLMFIILSAHSDSYELSISHSHAQTNRQHDSMVRRTRILERGEF